MERRKIDERARITLPASVCGSLQVAQGDYVQFVQNERGEWVLIRAHQG